MNERIKEFETDATLYADGYWDRDCPAWHQFYTEKFAELIVKECLDVIKKDPAPSLEDKVGLILSIKDRFDIAL